MGKYNLVCMAFDGEYKRERIDFNTIEEAWEHSDNIGSRWYFYPFHLVTTEKTVKSAPCQLECLNGKRIKTVAAIFKKCSRMQEAQGMDIYRFANLLNEKGV